MKNLPSIEKSKSNIRINRKPKSRFRIAVSRDPEKQIIIFFFKRRKQKETDTFSFEVGNRLDNKKLILSGEINVPVLDADKSRITILSSIEIQKIKIE
jgi:predicted nucleotidyltransferase